jgi:hypothetical protein
MRRLFYVADNVDDTQAISEALHREGVSDWHLHVLAKDQAGLYSHKIHSATPIQQLDFLHTGARYALVGLLAGIALGGVILGLSAMGWLGFAAPWWVVLLTGFLGTCFGAWEGGLVGLNRENYKIERFHDDIETGKYLIMVDVTPATRPHVKELMNFEFSHVPYKGGTSTVIGLFEKPEVIHEPTAM